MEPIPENILQQLSMHCESQDTGMIQLTHEVGITVIIMGPRSMSPGLVAVAGASLLLNDLLSGRLDASNAMKQDQDGPPN